MIMIKFLNQTERGDSCSWEHILVNAWHIERASIRPKKRRRLMRDDEEREDDGNKKSQNIFILQNSKNTFDFSSIF